MDKKPSALNPLNGFFHFLMGFSLLTHKGVRGWVLLPLSINIVLFGALIYLGVTQIDYLANQFEAWLPTWLNWLSWLLWPLFIVSAAMVVFFTFAMVGNFIAAPFNGALAAAVEQHLTGEPLPELKSSKSFFLGVLSMLGEELGKLFYTLSRLAVLMLLFFIPIVQLIAPFLMLMFSAWLFTLQYADFPMGNHGLGFKQQRELLRKRRLSSLGFGAATLGATLIPGLNLFVMPVAVAGATRFWVKELSLESEHT